jgi:CheY-like chemotaxis protein
MLQNKNIFLLISNIRTFIYAEVKPKRVYDSVGDADQKIPSLSLLYIDDCSLMLDLIKTILEKENHIQVKTCNTPEHAVNCIMQQKPDLIISDYCMAKMNGAEILSNVRSAGIGTPFIIFTTFAMDELDKGVFGRDSVHYVSKWGDISAQIVKLRSVIQQCVSR